MYLILCPIQNGSPNVFLLQTKVVGRYQFNECVLRKIAESASFHCVHSILADEGETPLNE